MLEEEKILDFRIDLNQEKELSDEEINDKYASGDIRIVTEQSRFQLNIVPTIVESEDYILDPEFQRRHRWSNTKKSKLIESFIMNVPVPPIFLYETEFSVYEVMDGLQRLTAIYEFYKDKFALTNLEEWSELNGRTYSQLPKQIKRGIDRRYLSSMILLKETARDPKEENRLKQLVFERINSGGEPLDDQEKRNALYNGDLNRLCIKLARTDSFCKLWNIPLNPDDEMSLIENPLYKKMTDVELVLRFFAFRQINLWERMTLTKFLDLYLMKGNEFSDKTQGNLSEIFIKTVDLIYTVLGEDALYLYRKRNGKWIVYNRPTKVLYDTIMQVFSKYLEFDTVLIRKSLEIRDGLQDFFEVNYQLFEGRNTGKTDVIKRIEVFDQYLRKFLTEE
ncbi:DUF262 domain-containing protein [Bacillus cereus]|uniref:GmrSD restriction endonucleases N-terminal domain-containing protein n=1 Tax=Bacillus cereus TaxID=1396 RepID=A0A2A9A591_BACCE|nr:DUF262 domain-containing protein [Bacillus cereus]PFE18916.1 hypothetical protein CN307_05095 [Bacillus cereus]